VKSRQSRLKSSLGCRKAACNTIREAKRQLHYLVVLSKSLSASRERARGILPCAGTRCPRSVTVAVNVAEAPRCFQSAYRRGEKKPPGVTKEPVTRAEVSCKVYDGITAIQRRRECGKTSAARVAERISFAFERAKRTQRFHGCNSNREMRLVPPRTLERKSIKRKSMHAILKVMGGIPLVSARISEFGIPRARNDRLRLRESSLSS